jgi:GNAT superfamily N-acetyltransferase
MMRLLPSADFSVMYQAERESDKDLFMQVDLTEEEYVRIASKYPSVGFEVNGINIGGMFIRANKLHLSVMPEYHGQWGWLFEPAFKWAFSVSDPLYAYVSRDNEKVLRFIRRHDWKQTHEIDSTIIFELTDLTTRYPK